eukprot:6436277-Prymnesium_polylepis.5
MQPSKPQAQPGTVGGNLHTSLSRCLRPHPNPHPVAPVDGEHIVARATALARPQALRGRRAVRQSEADFLLQRHVDARHRHAGDAGREAVQRLKARAARQRHPRRGRARRDSARRLDAQHARRSGGRARRWLCGKRGRLQERGGGGRVGGHAAAPRERPQVKRVVEACLVGAEGVTVEQVPQLA